MKPRKNVVSAFYALLRAGLWERKVQLASYQPLDWKALCSYAERQSVVGLLGAGLDYVEDVRLQKKDVAPFISSVYGLESRNRAMNDFLAAQVERMREAGIFVLLVKGQGIAQCYERPLWRMCGDVDFLLDQENYLKATALLSPLASRSKKEGRYSKHLGLTIDSWPVELHGSLRSGLSSRVDRVIDAVQEESFRNKEVRVWKCGPTDVLLPSVDNDIIFVFTHYLKHFYKGGILVRQVCDWCRLLWAYRGSVQIDLLEKRLRRMGLMQEWKTFAAFAVTYLGMPSDAMPLYDPSPRWSKKAGRVSAYILSFGYLEGRSSKNGKLRRVRSLSRIFPWSVLRFLPSIFFNVNRTKLQEYLG